jgi:hypothetical protein
MNIAPKILGYTDLNSAHGGGMVMSFSRAALAVCLLLGTFRTLRADIAALSTGQLVVNTSSSIFLPATATGNACVTGVLGGSPALAADFTSPAVTPTGFGGPAGCVNRFLVRSARQPSIFFTYYDLKNYTGYEGNTPAAKFPAPVSADDLIQAQGPPVQNSSVFTYAAGSFTSSETAVGGTVLFRRASLTAKSEVDLTNGQTGIATAMTFDPWIFTPESDTLLTLQVFLQNVNLQAISTGASILLVDGAFGMGSVPGQNVLALFTEGSFIGVTGGTLNIPSRTLFDNTGSPFLLLAGDTYWMTEDIETGAAAAAPEPGFTAVLTGMIAWLAWRAKRRLGRDTITT